MRKLSAQRAKGSVEALSDEQLVALLLSSEGPNSKATQQAKKLLAEGGGLRGLGRQLLCSQGLRREEAQSAIRRLAAGYELGLRMAERDDMGERPAIYCSQDVVLVLGPRLSLLSHEQVWLLALDGQNRLIAKWRVGQGGRHGCSLATSDVLRIAILSSCTSFVLVHNHPSGDPTPSQADIAFTNAMESASHVVGVPLLDHVIISACGHSSFLDQNLLGGMSRTYPAEASGRLNGGNGSDRPEVVPRLGDESEDRSAERGAKDPDG